MQGEAYVTDADMLRIGNQRMILWGLDAPERGQFCVKAGRRWGCEGAAKRTLQLLASQAEVACEMKTEPDRVGRRYAVCIVGNTINLNEQMVRRGMAVALEDQTTDYLDEQEKAQAEAIGLWADDVVFDMPWNFRSFRTPGAFR